MNILYLEDDPQDADLATRALKQTPQLKIEVVGTLGTARARLRSPQQVDVVLTDMRLPDGNGLDFLAEIRAQELPLAVVVLTGAGDQESAITALRAGADDYVVKRGDYLERLPATLRSALEHFKVNAARRRLRVLYAEHHATDIDLMLRRQPLSRSRTTCPL